MAVPPATRSIPVLHRLVRPAAAAPRAGQRAILVGAMRLLLVLPVLLSALLAQSRATVATHYYYWYRWPTEHFNEPGAPGREGHTRHFPEPQRVDYESVDWHADNFRTMGGAGIDAVLPVYWGAPGAYDLPHLRFARAGVPPMVAALERLEREGVPAPRVGLFYDTSTLRNEVRGQQPTGGRPDLTRDDGLELFCSTVADYFAMVPPRLWARHRGGALVVLYISAFAHRWDRRLGGELRTRFAARFPGEKLCLVADASWGAIGQDLTTAWGAALSGPLLFPGVAQLGPGYDDRVLPERNTPVREREDGAFYGFSWQRAIQHRPELVLLETWNEMHEGTELCPTRELGHQYVDLTRQWVTRFRAGDAAGTPIVLRFPEPRRMPNLSWGEVPAGIAAVAISFAVKERIGLREVQVDNASFVVEAGLLRPASGPLGRSRYLYFQVSDHFAFDTDAAFELEIVRAPGPMYVEYDAHPGAGALHGAFTPASLLSKSWDGEWLTEVWLLPRARFANRQNGGCDLRLVAAGRSTAIRSIELRRR